MGDGVSEVEPGIKIGGGRGSGSGVCATFKNSVRK